MKSACLNCQHEYDSVPGSVCPDDGGMLVPLQTDPLVGTTLDNKYEILEVLGGGGMGVVYKARHKLMNRIVAIKMLHKSLVSTSEALRRFQKEAEVASGLSHPNILTVFDFGVNNDGQPFMVMDCLHGSSLSELLEQEGSLPVERALKIFIQTCSGLGHAHETGILHRDLKPSNIMLVTVESELDFVKIVDFGVAKVLSNRGDSKEQLTKTGEVFGSPLYMSPEQCAGKNTDQRSDVYAMGCLIYRTLTGVPVFEGTEVLQILYQQMSKSPLAFSSACSHFDGVSEIEEIAFKAMAKNPNERFQSMKELGRALKRLQKKLAAETQPPGQGQFRAAHEEGQAAALLRDLKEASEPPRVLKKSSENFSPGPLRQPRISAPAEDSQNGSSTDTADGLAVIDALSQAIHFALGANPEAKDPVMAALQQQQSAALRTPLAAEHQGAAAQTGFANVPPVSMAPAPQALPAALPQLPVAFAPQTPVIPAAQTPVNLAPQTPVVPASQTPVHLVPQTSVIPAARIPVPPTPQTPVLPASQTALLSPSQLSKPDPAELPLSRFTNKVYEPGELRDRRDATTEARRMKRALREGWPTAKVSMALALIAAIACGATMFVLSHKPTALPQAAVVERFDSNSFDKQYKSALELCRKNKFADAIQVLSNAIVEAKKLGAPREDLSSSLSLRAKAYLDQGDLTKSESDARAALSVCQVAKGENSLGTAFCESELARVLLSSAHFTEADPLLRKALTTETQLGAPNLQRSTTLLNLAICEMKQSRKTEAKDDLQKAMALMPSDAARTVEIKHELQSLIDSKGDDDRAGAAMVERSRTHAIAAHPSVSPRRHAYSTYGY